MFCLLYDVITIYFSFSQTMDYNRRPSEYDLPEEHEDVSEFEDSDTEYEHEISDDEFDDQGRDNYENVPDYIPIEEEPLRLRASRNVAASQGASQQPQPGPSAAAQEPGPSAEDSGVLNVAFLEQDNSQFEDASSPMKRFSLRSAPRRNPSAKRSYVESDHSSDENGAGRSSRRTPAGRGLASYDPDEPSSDSDKDYVPEDDPASPTAPALPEETPKRPRGRGRGRPRSTPRGGRGRGRGKVLQLRRIL